MLLFKSSPQNITTGDVDGDLYTSTDAASTYTFHGAIYYEANNNVPFALRANLPTDGVGEMYASRIVPGAATPVMSSGHTALPGLAAGIQVGFPSTGEKHVVYFSGWFTTFTNNPDDEFSIGYRNHTGGSLDVDILAGSWLQLDKV